MNLRAPPPGAPVCVGYSGGLDSTVLLDLLADGSRPVTAVHVHHGLSPNAEAWAAHCAAFCEARRVPLAIERVHVDRDSGLGLEAAAREARYAVFAERPEPYVALGHHLDDQAETVLLQSLRGAGLKGIAAMPYERALNARVTLVRPLLEVPREGLLEHARARGLAWVDDESNAGAAHDRNFLRHALAPLLDARFPAWRGNLARLAAHAAGAQSLLEALAAIDGLGAEPGSPLPLSPELPEARRANRLRAWLAREGLPMPSEARLAEIDRQLTMSRDDARVEILHGDARIVRHRGFALALPCAPEGPWRIEWKGEREIELSPGLGRVAFEPREGEGIAQALLTRGEWYFASRQGGERLRPEAGRPSRTLKNLMQEAGVPAASRGTWPLLFHDNRLAWVPGVGIAAEVRAEPGEPGLEPLWKVTGRGVVC